jgi:hypothetical protein
MSFRFRPKTEKPFNVAASVVAAFKELSPADRSRVLNSVSLGCGRKLLSLSGFLAEAAINNNDPQLIEIAVALHVLEGFQNDYRENIRYLVLIAYAAKHVGVDMSAVISSVLAISSGCAAKGLNDFKSRSEDLNNLASFYIRGEFVDGVFRFTPA